jgi:hypothetical protein
MERKDLSLRSVTALLTEAGYRCAVPTCRTILAIDIHHIYEVSEGGGDEIGNLIALCPTCHRLYHRGDISRESIYSWKAMLIALSRAFDSEAIDLLLLLHHMDTNSMPIGLSGDGLLRFAGLIAAGLVAVKALSHHEYQVLLSSKGTLIVDAWKRGERAALKGALDSRVELK